MQTYRISQQGIRKARRDFILSSVLSGLALFSVIAIALTLLMRPTLEEGSTGAALGLYGGLLLVFIAGSGFGLMRGVTRITQQMSAYELQVSDNIVACKQLNQEMVRIRRGQIASIHERDKQGLLLRTERDDRAITVPDLLDDYDTVRAQLAGWAEIDTGPEPRRMLGAIMLWSLLNVIGVTIIFVIQIPLVVLVVGLMTLSSMLVISISMLRNPAISNRARLALLPIGLVVIIVVIRIVEVLPSL